MPSTGPDPLAYARPLALALDVDDAVSALRLARRLRPWFDVAKIGLELWAAEGPSMIGALTGLGYDVFLDLKLHDIPNQVGRTSAVLGAYDVAFVTVHAAGGPDMLRAAAEGLADGAAKAEVSAPVALGVTVLTSDVEAPPELLAERARLALDAGCGGLVCAAPDLAIVRGLAPGALLMVPGTRPTGADPHDQGRTATPAEALAGGADILVIGRAVTAAPDPEAAAAALVATLPLVP